MQRQRRNKSTHSTDLGLKPEVCSGLILSDPFESRPKGRGLRVANVSRIIIGLTGSFGSGKTLVSSMFKSWGAKVIDADILAHQAIRPKSSTYRKILQTFGKEIINTDKTINRKKLAKVVFNKKNLLEKLCGIIHPEVIRRINLEIKASAENVIVLDAPLLIEAGLDKIIDKLIVVKAKLAIQIERIQKKTSLSKSDVLKRIRTQAPLKDKIRLADFVIDNSGTIANTKRQAEQIRRLWWKS